MLRYRMWAPILLTPALAVALVSSGCGDKSDGKPTGGGPKTESGAGPGANVAKGGGGSGSASGEKSAMKAAGLATLKGKVTFAGDPPPAADIPIPDNNKDRDYCLKGDHRDPSWIVGADKGVANVVVWIRPPEGKFFEVPPEQQKPEQMLVKVDQPFCAFEPHVSVIFPSFYDPAAKDQKPTGQVFEVVNSAQIVHNTNWSPGNTLINQGGNEQLPQKAERKLPFKATQPKKFGQEDLISLKCNIHTWMTGYIWAFDHPYAAITKPDGTYEIKNVPAGSELRVVAWHERANFILPEGKGDRKGQTIPALKDNEHKELNFTVGK